MCTVLYYRTARQLPLCTISWMMILLNISSTQYHSGPQRTLNSFQLLRLFLLNWKRFMGLMRYLLRKIVDGYKNFEWHRFRQRCIKISQSVTITLKVIVSKFRETMKSNGRCIHDLWYYQFETRWHIRSAFHFYAYLKVRKISCRLQKTGCECKLLSNFPSPWM